MPPPPPPPPPSPYDHEIEYIECDGDQWIDTGVIPSELQSLAFEMEFTPLQAENGSAMFGSYYDWQHLGFSFWFYNVWRLTIGKHYVLITSIRDVIYHVNYDGLGLLKVNNSEYAITPDEIQEGGQIFIFRENHNGPTSPKVKARLYSMKLSNVRDFIPVRKDGKGYLFDRVSGQLFGNSGTGEFILGPDV